MNKMSLLGLTIISAWLTSCAAISLESKGPSYETLTLNNGNEVLIPLDAEYEDREYYISSMQVLSQEYPGEVNAGTGRFSFTPYITDAKEFCEGIGDNELPEEVDSLDDLIAQQHNLYCNQEVGG